MADLDYKRANTAAGGQQPGDDRQPAPDQRQAQRGSAARAAVAVIAAVVIAFCAWSMSEYVQGRDPLAFLGGSAAETEQVAGSEGSSESAADATASSDEVTLAADDVLAYITGDLSFNGKTIPVDADDVRVVLTEEGVWVEQESGGDAAALVDRTAQRAAALASWLSERAATGAASVSGVTWITEDAAGVIRVVVANDVSSTSASGDTSGNTASLLADARGYLISGETYAELGEVSYAASAGQVPTLPDGMALEVDAVVVEGADASDSGSEDVVRLVSVEETSATSGSSDSSSGGSDGASATKTTTSSPDSSTISVTVSVSGTASTVSVPAGSTALDALLATGASVEVGSNPYGAGSWVYAINGLGQDASHGWTYAVNGAMPSVMSDQYALTDGDSVSWNYVSA